LVHWIRKRLDISRSDILYGVFSVLSLEKPASVRKRIVGLWQTGKSKAQVVFCVRSGLDLILQAAGFSKDSEIITSALTIPDIPRIMRFHGLIPVPVDIQTGTTIPRAEDIEALITPKTKAIMIAHLFGAKGDLEPIAEIARKHNLLLIEDRAQCYEPGIYRGSDSADISMYSFGTIKTATALGCVSVQPSENVKTESLNGYCEFSKGVSSTRP